MLQSRIRESLRLVKPYDEADRLKKKSKPEIVTIVKNRPEFCKTSKTLLKLSSVRQLPSSVNFLHPT